MALLHTVPTPSERYLLNFRAHKHLTDHSNLEPLDLLAKSNPVVGCKCVWRRDLKFVAHRRVTHVACLAVRSGRVQYCGLVFLLRVIK